jgi:hypothetical protein
LGLWSPQASRMAWHQAMVFLKAIENTAKPVLALLVSVIEGLRSTESAAQPLNHSPRPATGARNGTTGPMGGADFKKTLSRGESLCGWTENVL